MSYVETDELHITRLKVFIFLRLLRLVFMRSMRIIITHTMAAPMN